MMMTNVDYDKHMCVCAANNRMVHEIVREQTKLKTMRFSGRYDEQKIYSQIFLYR